MKITQEVREYAAEHGLTDEQKAIEAGFAEQSERFKRGRRGDLPAGVSRRLACRQRWAPLPALSVCGVQAYVRVPS